VTWSIAAGDDRRTSPASRHLRDAPVLRCSTRPSRLTRSPARPRITSARSAPARAAMDEDDTRCGTAAAGGEVAAGSGVGRSSRLPRAQQVEDQTRASTWRANADIHRRRTITAVGSDERSAYVTSAPSDAQRRSGRLPVRAPAVRRASRRARTSSARRRSAEVRVLLAGANDLRAGRAGPSSTCAVVTAGRCGRSVLRRSAGAPTCSPGRAVRVTPRCFLRGCHGVHGARAGGHASAIDPPRRSASSVLARPESVGFVARSLLEAAIRCASRVDRSETGRAPPGETNRSRR